MMILRELIFFILSIARFFDGWLRVDDDDFFPDFFRGSCGDLFFALSIHIL